VEVQARWYLSRALKGKPAFWLVSQSATETRLTAEESVVGR
jgi:hypothetical protein